MADSYQVLKGKYEMALSSIRELEQERDIANHKISKMQEERAKQDKSTKYLCETILKKEKEKKGEVPWFKLDLPDMIDEIIIIPAPIHPTIVGILTISNIPPAIDVPSTAF